SGVYQIYSAAVEVPSRLPEPTKLQQLDVSKLVILRYDPAHYDPERMEMVVPVRLYNKSQETIYGPLVVHIADISSKKYSVLDAASGGKRARTEFDYSNTLRDLRSLGPGQITEPVVWRIKNADWSESQVSVSTVITGYVRACGEFMQ